MNKFEPKSEEQILQERMEKFKALNIPMPMKPIDPSTINRTSGNPLIQKIKNGALKEQFGNILSKGTPNKGFNPLPIPKTKQKPGQPQTNSPKVESFQPSTTGLDAEAKRMEALLYGGGGGSASSYSDTLSEQVEPGLDSYGDNIPVRDVRAEFHQRMQQKGTQPSQEYMQYAQQPQPNSHGNNINLTEEEFKRRVIAISRAVAKKVSSEMIKQVILEYVKSGKDIIVESKNIKKAEIVGAGKVKIEGKVYKLVLEK